MLVPMLDPMSAGLAAVGSCNYEGISNLAARTFMVPKLAQ